jgi:hypothetical protein
MPENHHADNDFLIFDFYHSPEKLSHEDYENIREKFSSFRTELTSDLTSGNKSLL